MFSPEELQYVRSAASTARENLDEANIILAKQKLHDMYAALPADLQIPCEDFQNMRTLAELTAFKELTLLIGNPPGIPRRIPNALCTNWPVTNIPALVNVELSDADKAHDLLMIQTRTCPSFLSFSTRRVNDGSAAYNMALTIHAQGLQIPNITNTNTTKAALILALKTFDLHAQNSGSTHSFLSTFSADAHSYLIKELTRRFPNEFIQYEGNESSIPETLFISYLLIFISEVHEQDKLEILQIVKSPKMIRTDNGVAFSYENYSKYVGEFTKNLSVYGRFLQTVNAKSFARILVRCWHHSWSFQDRLRPPGKYRRYFCSSFFEISR